MAAEVVYLARHGRTEWNVQRRRQGRLDSPLTPEGVEQARRLAATADRLEADAVYSSPLGRARTTAAAVGERLGLSVTVLDELCELDHGRFTGITEAQFNSVLPGALDARERDRYRWRFPDGESYADAEERARVALATVLRAPARRPLVVSHGMLGRVLLRVLLDEPVEAALARSQPHDVIYRVDVRGRRVAEIKLDEPVRDPEGG